MSAEHQAALAELGRIALEKADLVKLLEESASLVAETLGVEFCKILELLPGGDSFLLRAGVGWKEGLVGQAVVPATSETHAGHALVSGVPAIVEDFRTETRFHPSLLHEHDARSGVSVVIPGAKPFGVLAIHTSSHRSFSPHEVAFLESVAEVLSRAIHRHRTLEAIRQSEERFRRTFEDSSIGMAIVDLDHCFVEANSVVYELLAYSKEEFKQLTIEQITHPDDLPKTMELAGKLFSGKISHFRLEKRNLTKSGETVWVDLTATLVRDDQGKPLHAVWMIEDISTQRQRERELRLARFTLDHAQEAIVWAGPDGRIAEINEATVRLLGYSRPELLSMSMPDVDPTVSAEAWPQAWKELKRLGALTRESRFRRKDGREVPVELSVNYLEHNSAQYACTIARDITERKRAVAELEASEGRYRNLFENAAAMVWILDLDANITSVNETTERYSGYRREELVGKNIAELLSPDQFELARSMTERKLREGGATTYELEIITKDGRRLPMQITSRLIHENGKPVGVQGFVIDVSEQRRAQEALRRSEERYRNLFENAAAMVWMIDLNGCITSVNEPAERFSGYQRAELIGKNIAELLSPDQLQIARSMIAHKHREDGTTTYDLEIVTKDGRRRPMQITSRLVRENGRLIGVQGIGINISEQRRTQQALRQSEEHFRALIENALDLITILDTSGTVRYVSPSIERVLGYRPEERFGKSTFELIHPDDLPRVREALDRGCRTPNASAALEFRIRHQDGSWRYLAAVARNLLDNPAVGGVVVNSRDISERKLAEETIRTSEEWFRSSFQYAGVPMAITSVDGHFLQANPALSRFLGRSEQELLKLSWVDVTHPDDIEPSREVRRRLLGGGAPSVAVEKRYVHKEGRLLWGYLTLSLIHDAEGRPDRIVAQIVDTTGRRKAEEALRQSEIRFRLAAESASDFIYEWDVRSGRLDWHGDVDACLGYRRGQFPRTIEAWKESLHPDDRGRVLQVVDYVPKGAMEPLALEYRIKTRKGDYRHWLDRGRWLRDEAGTAYKCIGACSDITERKQTEEALRASEAELRSSREEMRALADRLLGSEEEEHRRLARELHDDFSQRLTAVVYQLAEVEEACPANVSARLKKKLHSARDRVADLSEDMRRLAHQLHPAAIELFGLPAALRQQCQETSRLGRMLVRFSGRKLPEAIPGEVALCLYRVTQESLRNIAKHARADKVSVTLSGAPRRLRLSIKDNGRGFDQGKAETKGGLGMISMKERVRLAGGRLLVKSQPGQGTQVVVEVPLPKTHGGR